MGSEMCIRDSYNSPNSEPPQACLLAVSPTLTGEWEWDDLMDTLEETIDWAIKRAVDPDLLDQTPYAQVLPTVMTALAGGSGALALDFKRNIVDNPIPGSVSPIILNNYEITAFGNPIQATFNWQDFENTTNDNP